MQNVRFQCRQCHRSCQLYRKRKFNNIVDYDGWEIGSNLQSAGISLLNSKEYMTHHAKKIRLIKSEIVDAINLREFFR
jgi:hypothetical protein